MSEPEVIIEEEAEPIGLRISVVGTVFSEAQARQWNRYDDLPDVAEWIKGSMVSLLAQEEIFGEIIEGLREIDAREMKDNSDYLNSIIAQSGAVRGQTPSPTMMQKLNKLMEAQPRQKKRQLRWAFDDVCYAGYDSEGRELLYSMWVYLPDRVDEMIKLKLKFVDRFQFETLTDEDEIVYRDPRMR